MTDTFDNEDHMPYILVKPDGTTIGFYVLDVACMYRNIYGGVIKGATPTLVDKTAA